LIAASGRSSRCARADIGQPDVAEPVPGDGLCCAATSARRRPGRLQVAVGAAVGQLALGLGERDQRVVLAGEVAQPVVVLAAVGEQVDDLEPAVEVEKSP
jgi:hypothetical protein